MKVFCDECKKEFEYEHKTKYLGAMITETYVECPHCKEKYTVRLDNNLTRKLERKIKGLKISLSSNKLTYGLRKTLNKALDDNIEFHKQAMSSLMKGEYSWRYQTK